MIIAIDGPAGSGKSTTARLVAQALGFLYLNTGAMYRAVALACMRAGQPMTPAALEALLPTLHLDVRHQEGEMHVFLEGEDVTEALRAPAVGKKASEVALFEVVRHKMVEEQRRIGHAVGEDGGVVLEGRDIGTVVFPDADLKIFLVATPEVRARRRQAELAARGTPVVFETLLAEIQQRDRQDSERLLSPLRRAEDALVLDTTHRTIEQQVAFVVARARERMSSSPV